MSLKLKYFVLNPDSSDVPFAIASRKALLAFAEEIEDVEEDLADDLRHWVFNLDLKDGV